MSTVPPAASLNPGKLEAVRHLACTRLVITGAGSGKTRVITTWIGQLLLCTYRPSQIAANAITNNAAQKARKGQGRRRGALQLERPQSAA